MVFWRSTEAHNQDTVSMSAIAARDARTIVELGEEVCTIVLLSLCQALDLRGRDQSAPQLRRVHALIRRHVPVLQDDRVMEDDIRAVLRLIRGDAFSDLLQDAPTSGAAREAHEAMQLMAE